MKKEFDFVEYWAKEVKNSNGKWKLIHTEFINSQFKKADYFIKELAKEKNGPEKIKKIYNIKNVNGYPSLLKN